MSGEGRKSGECQEVGMGLAHDAQPGVHGDVRVAQLVANFVFQAEDGIRYGRVTGVQTCALPILNATQTMAVEFAPKVRVNAVVVGLVVTEQAHLFYGGVEGIEAVGATVPLGRMADPSDVGDVCLFLASSLASYVSGAEIVVHGGGEKPT